MTVCVAYVVLFVSITAVRWHEGQRQRQMSFESVEPKLNYLHTRIDIHETRFRKSTLKWKRTHSLTHTLTFKSMY